MPFEAVPISKVVQTLILCIMDSMTNVTCATVFAHAITSVFAMEVIATVITAFLRIWHWDRLVFGAIASARFVMKVIPVHRSRCIALFFFILDPLTSMGGHALTLRT